MPDTHAIFATTEDDRPFRLAAISYAGAPTTLSELADRVGELKAAQADINDELARLKDQLAKSGESEAEGCLFRVTLSAASCSTILDRKAIERDMGEAWIAKYLKWSKPSRAMTCAAKTGKAKRAA